VELLASVTFFVRNTSRMNLRRIKLRKLKAKAKYSVYVRNGSWEPSLLNNPTEKIAARSDPCSFCNRMEIIEAR